MVVVASQSSLADAKRNISKALLDEPGVSGVGLRAGRVVVYLETDDAGKRKNAERVAQRVEPAVDLTFEVTGQFGKQ
jgi:hypothetical protein